MTLRPGPSFPANRSDSVHWANLDQDLDMLLMEVAREDSSCFRHRPQLDDQNFIISDLQASLRKPRRITQKCKKKTRKSGKEEPKKSIITKPVPTRNKQE
eukprot:TRINITY_DN1276_c0_g1_i1.p2 TRINITY_DN1276_c0_g1~~TRINITY_DN1276_c0_g1_i1.p2  ORF type:complete len:100 (-),score=13.86 TRINITY_DN1276_c0_g1_i1:63-362(-)